MSHEVPIYHLEPAPVLATATEQPIFEPTTDNQREVLQKLEQGFDQVATDAGFQRWLKTMRTFHQYSLTNTLLIMAQRPDATHVMGYGTRRAGPAGNRSGGRSARVRRGSAFSPPPSAG